MKSGCIRHEAEWGGESISVASGWSWTVPVRFAPSRADQGLIGGECNIVTLNMQLIISAQLCLPGHGSLEACCSRGRGLP